jgi:hypothetical protein
VTQSWTLQSVPRECWDSLWSRTSDPLPCQFCGIADLRAKSGPERPQKPAGARSGRVNLAQTVPARGAENPESRDRFPHVLRDVKGTPTDAPNGSDCQFAASWDQPDGIFRRVMGPPLLQAEWTTRGGGVRSFSQPHGTSRFAGARDQRSRTLGRVKSRATGSESGFVPTTARVAVGRCPCPTGS